MKPRSCHCVVFLGKTLNSNTVPVSTQGYKWVPVNCKGNRTKCWGEGAVTCNGLASHPGGVAMLLVASCYKNQDKLLQARLMTETFFFNFIIYFSLYFYFIFGCSPFLFSCKKPTKQHFNHFNHFFALHIFL